MRTGLVLGLALVLTACGGSEEKSDPAASPQTAAATPAGKPLVEPDLSACAAFPASERADMNRDTALEVPQEFTGLVKADLEHFAISTLGGGTHCLDVRWMTELAKAQQADNHRFLIFDWSGYEAYGHVIIDRSGSGSSIDTGEPASFSPNRSRIAAVDLGEAGFGALNAFAVWDVGTTGLTEAAKVTEGLPLGSWTLEAWQGEDCIELSALATEDQPSDAAELEKAPRDPWFAAKARDWKPEPGRCPPA